MKDPRENKDIAMKLQDRLEELATTAFERKVIRLWLREGKARSSFVRALGASTCTSNKDTSLNPGLKDTLPERV